MSIKNASAFELKRKRVLVQTHLRFNQNVLAFTLKRKDVLRVVIHRCILRLIS